MVQVVLFIAGFLFPPIWFCMGGKYIADAHRKERQEHAKKRRKMNAPKRAGVAASKRHERSIASTWRQRYQKEHKKRVDAEAREKILKRINKAQQPMANDGVNIGTYELYRSGFKRIIATTFKRQRLSTYTMPEIRGICDEMLGASKPTEFHGWNKSGKPRTRAPKGS
ncbi:MAG: hypothetical protein OES69_16230 [Myxococcales bacterium]|nr:hypothetical protein [Myxococcales bacterium]